MAMLMLSCWSMLTQAFSGTATYNSAVDNVAALPEDDDCSSQDCSLHMLQIHGLPSVRVQEALQLNTRGGQCVANHGKADGNVCVGENKEGCEFFSAFCHWEQVQLIPEDQNGYCDSLDNSELEKTLCDQFKREDCEASSACTWKSGQRGSCIARGNDSNAALCANAKQLQCEFFFDDCLWKQS